MLPFFNSLFNILIIVYHFSQINSFFFTGDIVKMPRECKNSPDSFCYLYRTVTLRQYKRQLTQHVKKLYELYFGCKVGDQDKRWAPHICCVRCTSSLSAWVKDKGPGLMFGIPMVWREPKDHSTDGYFCLTNIKDGYSVCMLYCF